MINKYHVTPILKPSNPNTHTCPLHCKFLAHRRSSLLSSFFSESLKKMSFRAILSSRSLVNISRSTQILRSFSIRSRLGVGIVSRNGFRGVPQMRGFQSSALRAFPAPQEGMNSCFGSLLIVCRIH